MMHNHQQYQLDAEYRNRQMRQVLKEEFAALSKDESSTSTRAKSFAKARIVVGISVGLALAALLLIAPLSNYL